ncbi:DUF2561 family protein [Mycolicibacterium sp. XJ1819]
MAYQPDSGRRSPLSAGLDPAELDRVDRILLGSCGGIWLAALGTGVAATVALVDLGRGHAEAAGDSGTPWLLYSVIGISAVVIVGAVPLLLRARREATQEEPPPRPAERPQASPAARGGEAPTEKLRVTGASVGRLSGGPGYSAPWAHSPSLPASLVAAVDQIWLRCAVVIISAMGIAMVAIGIATYLSAIGSNAAGWVFYVLAGLVAVAMPAVPWFYLNELRALLDE